MRGRVLALLLLILAGLGHPAGAAEWGTISPGTSTTTSVRGQYGAPTRATSLKVESYDTDQWVYEGPQAPVGMRRMTVDFGLLTSTGFRREIVRSVRLDPNPGVFTRETILAGWGQPSHVSPAGQPPSFVYTSGLIVGFDSQGWEVEWMMFTPPQPEAPAGPRP